MTQCSDVAIRDHATGSQLRKSTCLLAFLLDNLILDESVVAEIRLAKSMLRHCSSLNHMHNPSSPSCNVASNRPYRQIHDGIDNQVLATRSR